MKWREFRHLMGREFKPEHREDLLFKLLKEIKLTLDDLVAKVTAENTVIDSAVTLLGTLKTELDAAIASGDPAKIQAVSDLITTGQQKLADAVVANTPVVPQPPAPPPAP